MFFTYSTNKKLLCSGVYCWGLTAWAAVMVWHATRHVWHVSCLEHQPRNKTTLSNEHLFNLINYLIWHDADETDLEFGSRKLPRSEFEYLTGFPIFFKFKYLCLYLLKLDFQGKIWNCEIMRISKLSKIMKFGEGIPEKTMLLLRATSFSDTL